ncbi:MAG: plasmid stabilization protein [Stackebrandtia sp.]
MPRRRPQSQWSAKRVRQYEEIKESQRERGAGEERAEEIAARTVNKDRARAGESRRASKASTKDVSPERRGGKRSGKRLGPGGRTRDQLYREAQRKNIKGRSGMNKDELEKAVGRS